MLAGWRGVVLEVSPPLHEDAAVKRLEVQRLLPAMAMVAAEEHERHPAAVRGGEVSDISKR